MKKEPFIFWRPGGDWRPPRQNVVGQLRAAEEVVFDEMTSGASNDIEMVTRLARAMVIDFGMSELGPVNLGPQQDLDEQGKVNWFESSSISPAMQEKVDKEVKRIIDEAYSQSIAIVKKERKSLDKVSTALLKKETLNKEDFEKVVGKKREEKGQSKLK